ncbi:MAG: Rieske (2Fe-2S) protein [Verrucomicrobiaceae bacterium]|nr:Rieske (2Fe-2S) protein [Verrucomicrobiaceae bacterium]
MTRTCPLKSPLLYPQGLPDSFLSRREWIKRFAIGSAVSLSGAGFKSTLLADIAPGTNPANILEFNIATYPTLTEDYGSLRFNIFGNLVPIPANSIITITRAPGNVFYAMSAYCTHAGCIVDPYDNSPGTEAMICYCHSSVYNIQGQIINEATPGQANLPAYNTSFSGGTLRVEIPNLNFKVNNITPATAVGGIPRFLMSFPAKAGGKYRILHTDNLNNTPMPVSFATTATGAATNTQITQTSNATRNVWVPSTATSGFYMVEMIVAQYVP